MRFLLVLSVLLFSGCTQRIAWNQKLTLTVRMPDGEVSASSVTEVKYSVNESEFRFGGVGSSQTWGEAVVLRLGDDRYLFVLLEESLSGLARYTFPEIKQEPVSGGYSRWARAVSRHRGVVGVVPRDKYPIMATFDDLNVPLTVQRVGPDDLQLRPLDL